MHEKPWKKDKKILIWNALGGAAREIGPVDFYKATTAPMAPQTWR